MIGIKRVGILKGVLNAQNPFDVDMRESLINDSLKHLRVITKAIYKQLNKKMQETRKKYIEKKV